MSLLSLFTQIILHSMHKYQPRVHIIRKDFSSELSPNKLVPTGEGVKTFSFPETVFTTVTAYQNQQVNCSASVQMQWLCLLWQNNKAQKFYLWSTKGNFKIKINKLFFFSVDYQIKDWPQPICQRIPGLGSKQVYYEFSYSISFAFSYSFWQSEFSENH